MNKIKVGIVEDELMIAHGIAGALAELDYIPVGPAINYTEALEMIEKERPDILLLDIVLSGYKDGIDVAWKVKEDYNIPFIFLTANSDAATVERAKKVCPPAYLLKPFDKDDLYTSIEICLYNFTANKRGPATVEKDNFLINDCLFIKQTHNFIKVKLDDITYIESDRMYLTVHTTTTKYLVRSKLQDYIELIASKNFLRVHRSYVVNIIHVAAINTNDLSVRGFTIPLGKPFRDELLNALKLG